MEVIKDREAYINNAKEEIKRLQAIVKVNDNLVNRLKDNLLTAVKTFGSFEVGFVKFGTRISKSVNVDSEMINQLPNEYKTIKVTESANKTAIKKALQDGVEINGCELVTNLNLNIK